MATGQALLYQEQFEVKEISKKFDKVARLTCRLAEEGYDMGLELDINSDLYPLEVNDKFTFALASTLSPDGSPGSEHYEQNMGSSLMDQYEYVMYGKIYKWKQEHSKSPIEVLDDNCLDLLCLYVTFRSPTSAVGSGLFWWFAHEVEGRSTASSKLGS